MLACVDDSVVDSVILCVEDLVVSTGVLCVVAEEVVAPGGPQLHCPFWQP